MAHENKPDITNDSHDDIVLRSTSGTVGYWDFSNGGSTWSFNEIQKDLADWQVVIA